MYILGIETSCDETAAAIIKAQSGRIFVLSNIIASQIEIHKKFGGVVPEVAAREHVKTILPVINQAFKTAKLSVYRAPEIIEAIAVTVGPGLITSLLVGVETAKTLAFVWNKPLVPVNHIIGHIYASFIEDGEKISFPAIILTVSGGHTLLALMKGHGQWQIIGQTRDDAAGEAFDKAAQLLNLGYPGGPAIARQAAKAKKEKPIDPLPRPMLEANNFDFSFSGLKTALLYRLQADKNWPQKIPSYCAEFEQAVVDVLVAKTIKAVQKFRAQSIILTGGVAANQRLRAQMKQAVKKQVGKANFFIAPLSYCTDNAAMIAAAGHYQAQLNQFSDYKSIKANPQASF